MAKVLVDEEQITQLGLTIDDQKQKTDTIFTLLQELKQEIADLNAATPDEIDLSPLLDKANALDDELGSMTPPVVPDTQPAPAPPPATEPAGA